MPVAAMGQPSALAVLSHLDHDVNAENAKVVSPALTCTQGKGATEVLLMSDFLRFVHGTHNRIEVASVRAALRGAMQA